MTTAERTANTLAELIASHRVVKVDMQAEHAVCVANVDLPEYGIKAGEQFELVKCGSFEGYAYILTETPEGRQCSCPATVRNCKHIRLASQSAVVRYYARKEAGKLVLEPVLAAEDEPVHVEDDVRMRRFPTREDLAKIGRTDMKPFSLLA